MLSDSPPDRDLQWSETGIIASNKFINKLWDFVSKYENYKPIEDSKNNCINELKIKINNVSKYIDDFQFNKSVAKIYEFSNFLSEITSKEDLSKKDFKWSLEKLSLILQPFVPHISEEIWSSINKDGFCINQQWPIENVEYKDVNVNIAIQINGKTKHVLSIDSHESKERVLEIVKNDPKIIKFLTNKEIIREIYVPGKIVNFVL